MHTRRPTRPGEPWQEWARTLIDLYGKRAWEHMSPPVRRQDFLWTTCGVTTKRVVFKYAQALRVLEAAERQGLNPLILRRLPYNTLAHLHGLIGDGTALRDTLLREAGAKRTPPRTAQEQG